MENKKHEKHNNLTLIIVILLFLITLAGTFLYFTINANEDKGLTISTKQLSAQNPNLLNKKDDEYFELVGFGQLNIYEDNKYLNMINPSENSVYLSFDVIYNDVILYKTELIEPGKMEQFDIYSNLDAGQYTITYLINVYDIATQKPLWSGIQQEQEILVIK